MAVFRIERTRDYTVMSNHHLRNEKLSLKAKGLLSMMLSLPENWNYTTRGLAAICKEGVDAIGGALRELETAGYIVRHQLRDRHGRISDTEYVIDLSEQKKEPEQTPPAVEEPAAEEPAAPELDPIDRLAADIDQFSFDYDTYEYRDRVDDREEALRELTAALHDGDSDGIRDWLREFADENEPGEANEKAMELLERLDQLVPMAEPEQLDEPEPDPNLVKMADEAMAMGVDTAWNSNEEYPLSFNTESAQSSAEYDVINREQFETWLRQDGRNAGLFTQEEKEPPAPEITSEPVTVYPGDKNGLPYDVVVERLHIDEPEPTPPEPAPPLEPAGHRGNTGQLRQDAQNFRITDDHLGEGGPRLKYQANITAIRLLKELDAAGQQASPEQQEVLSRYVGWGGVPEAFDPSKTAWAKEYAELKELLTPEEYEAARASTLNAHYTSPMVIRAIYEAVEQMGFHSGNILDKTTPRLIQFHTFKNAANPPFLGGFSIFSIVAA